ncbi:MAG: DeoR family transcriptional regulator [Acidimicrobiia bacterium]
MLAADRQRRTLELIGSNGSVLVSDLVDEFGVSRMTINRDLDYLAGIGAVTKVHGGAISTTDSVVPSLQHCQMCGMENGDRTAMTLFHEGGAQSQACCPHCGLMLLSQQSDVTSALALDFIGGQMVNVRTATFLVAPDVTVCCVPTVLCFGERGDAERFSQGFGGRLTSWEEAQVDVRDHMTLMKEGMTE